MVELLSANIESNVALMLFGVAIIAGFIDAIAGGGGLLTVPSLLLAGVPPITALGTNRLQSVIGELTATWVYIRSGQMPTQGLFKGLCYTTVGALAGSFCVSTIDNEHLKTLLPILMLGVTCYSIFSKKLKSTITADAVLSNHVFMLCAGLSIGFYNGFFGPGTGAFWMIAFVAFLGYNLTQATMVTKPVNLVGNLVSLGFFAYISAVDVGLGLMMGAGQVIGANVGSRTVLKTGHKLIRPIFITVTLIMTVKFFVEGH